MLINTFTGSNKASEKDYSMLRIENGFPIYELNLDRSSLNSLLTLKSTSINKINDGKWHTIEIWKNGQVCKLKNGYFLYLAFIDFVTILIINFILIIDSYDISISLLN